MEARGKGKGAKVREAQEGKYEVSACEK